jgi:predicted ArsR family transcriptional regulator
MSSKDETTAPVEAGGTGGQREPTGPGAEGPGEVRELTDPRAMRAITHPVRLALLEALGLEGPLTATTAAEVISESPTTCSFHFRQLAKYGFVEQAARGPGRTRSWRLTTVGMRFTDVHDDPEATLAARALDRALRQRSIERLQRFYELRASYPRRWQEVTGASEFMLHVSPEELRALDEEITAILQRYRPRIADPELRPADSLPIELLLFAYPVRAPGA